MSTSATGTCAWFADAAPTRRARIPHCATGAANVSRPLIRIFDRVDRLSVRQRAARATLLGSGGAEAPLNVSRFVCRDARAPRGDRPLHDRTDRRGLARPPAS